MRVNPSLVCESYGGGKVGGDDSCQRQSHLGDHRKHPLYFCEWGRQMDEGRPTLWVKDKRGTKR